MKFSIEVSCSILAFVIIIGFWLANYPVFSSTRNGNPSLHGVQLFAAPDYNPYAPQPTKALAIPDGSFQNATQQENSTPGTFSKSEATTTNSGINTPNLAIGLYESNPTQGNPVLVKSINWSTNGPIIPGQSPHSSTIYLRNEGTAPITVNLFTANWAFTNSTGSSLSIDYQQYFTINWDYNNSSIPANQVIPIIFTLTVAANITNVATFSFDIIVTAS